MAELGKVWGMRNTSLLLIALLLASNSAFAAAAKPEPGGEKKKDPAYATVTDDPKLPRVLLIGDSISIGYTVATRELLKDKANVHRILTNGGPTSTGVQNIDKWLGEGKWDVIHFNFGLHDLKVMEGKHQVPVDQYEKNLRAIVERMQKTGAKLIFATTTPVPEGKVNPPRVPADVSIFNAAALKVMTENKVAIDDLYAFALPRLKEIQLNQNVHFSAAGSKALAGEVAKSIEQALADKAKAAK